MDRSSWNVSALSPRNPTYRSRLRSCWVLESDRTDVAWSQAIHATKCLAIRARVRDCQEVFSDSVKGNFYLIILARKKTSNTFLSLCFYRLLFNLFWTSKLNFIFTYCSPIWKWCLQMVMLPAQPTLHLDGRFSLLIIKIISWIIMNKLFNRQISSVGDWVRPVCRISSFCNVENIKQDTKLFIPYQDIELHSRRDCVGKR